VREVVVLDAARTAIGKSFRGGLADVRADDLGSTVIAALLARNDYLQPGDVSELYWGCSLPDHSQGYNTARQVGLLGGLPVTVPAITLSRSCGSALSALRMAAHAIAVGDGEVYVAGGGDSFSLCLGKGFSPADHHPRFTDTRRPDFINFAYMEVFDTAEIVAARYGVTRTEMDEFALLSHSRASRAAAAGYFDSEIVPFELPNGTIFAYDDSPRTDSSFDSLAALRSIAPALGGRVTAGNTCVAGDGAGALILASAEWARMAGAEPLARIAGSSVAGLEPEMMGLGSVPATRALLDRAGMTIRDVDIVEVHENFAAQVIPVCAELHIDPDGQLNPYGGAIAIGHPPGMTGARLVMTLINGLAHRDQQIGLATTCVAGGQGLALMLERLR
jgi:acetyl-CoA C-acetyltransferase